MTTQELRNKAADYIEAHGWCQGRYEDDGRVCVVGALRMAAFGAIDRNFEMPTVNAYRSACGELAHGIETPVSTWNDAPERTQAEVIAKLRETPTGA